MTIRRVEQDDLNDVARIDAEAYGGSSYDRYSIRQLFDVVRPLFLVALAESRVIGYTIGAVVIDNDKTAWVLSLAVGESTRRRGVGRALTVALVGELAARHCDTVRLTVHPNNVPALTLYTQLGFTEVGRETAYFGAGEPRIVMEKRG